MTWTEFPSKSWETSLCSDHHTNPGLEGVHFLPNGTLLVADRRRIHRLEDGGETRGTIEKGMVKQIGGSVIERILSPQCMTDISETQFAFTDRHNMTVHIYSTPDERSTSLEEEIFRHLVPGEYPATAPYGIVRLRNGHVAVSDKLQCKIHVVDMVSEQVVRSVESSDTNYPFQEPTFLALDSKGRILVTDRVANNIKQLDGKGEFKYIGKFNAGTKRGGSYRCLQGPGAVVVNQSNGDMLIANNDVNNRLIHVDQRGQFVRVVDLERTGLGASIPNALALKNNSTLAMTANHHGTVTVLSLID